MNGLINTQSKIRTPNPRKRAAADPRLRPRGHCDRLTLSLLSVILRRGIPVVFVKYITEGFTVN